MLEGAHEQKGLTALYRKVPTKISVLPYVNSQVARKCLKNSRFSNTRKVIRKRVFIAIRNDPTLMSGTGYITKPVMFLIQRWPPLNRTFPQYDNTIRYWVGSGASASEMFRGRQRSLGAEETSRNNSSVFKGLIRQPSKGRPFLIASFSMSSSCEGSRPLSITA